MPRSAGSRNGADPTPTATKTKANGASNARAAAGFAPLSREQIRAQTDDGSFGRGQSYHRNGRIFDAIRRGATLRARCHGSSGGPYLVEVTLAEAGTKRKRNPLAYDCDCPRGGFCKHVVALLLTWADDPAAFEVRPPLAELLAERSRDELVALVERMVERYPDLEGLVELPMPVGSVATRTVVDAASVRRQAAAAFSDAGPRSYRGERYSGYGDGWGYGSGYGSDDWGAAGRVSVKLQPLVDLGASYAEAGAWRNAALVFGAVAAETIPNLGIFQDEEGTLAEVLVACDAGLAECLDAQGGLPEQERLPEAERAALIKTLFDIWRADVAIGGIDLAQEGPVAIARGATGEERQRVGGWLRELIEPDHDRDADDFSRSWTPRAAIGFLSRLGPDGGLSDEELLAEYRTAELWEEAAESLVRLGRVEEGIALAARRLTAAAVLTRFADRLVATGDPHRIRQAIDLVDARLWEREGVHAHDDTGYLLWLERQYAAIGQPAKALETARRRFKLLPSKETYDAVRAAAELPGQPDATWSALRPQVMATLRKQGAAHALIAIHLEAGEVGDAVAAVEQGVRTAATAGWYGGSGLDAQVAAAAEHDLPDAAIAIYRRLADRAIDMRQRVSYREAAASLARVKLLLERERRADEWAAIIDDLRRRHKSLRALREELDALGLR